MIFGNIQMWKFKKIFKQGICEEDNNANEAMNVIDEKPDPFALKKWLTVREINFKQPVIFFSKSSFWQWNDCNIWTWRK